MDNFSCCELENLVVDGDDGASLFRGRIPRDGDVGGERESGDGVGVAPQG